MNETWKVYVVCIGGIVYVCNILPQGKRLLKTSRLRDGKMMLK